MSRIQLALRHLTTAEAEQAWAAVQTEEGSDLADNLAVTIASWWQSPGTVGRHLAALASGAPVSSDDLIADVEATLAELRQHTPTHPAPEGEPMPAERTLPWLAEWAGEWSWR